MTSKLVSVEVDDLSETDVRTCKIDVGLSQLADGSVRASYDDVTVLHFEVTERGSRFPDRAEEQTELDLNSG